MLYGCGVAIDGPLPGYCVLSSAYQVLYFIVIAGAPVSVEMIFTSFFKIILITRQ